MERAGLTVAFIALGSSFTGYGPSWRSRLVGDPREERIGNSMGMSPIRKKIEDKIEVSMGMPPVRLGGMLPVSKRNL